MDTLRIVQSIPIHGIVEVMDGIRFTCQRGCTRCCEVRGFVYLSEDDLRRAAAYLGLTPDAFEEKYVVRYAHIIRLRKPLDAQCHFLTSEGCSIHPAKPTQCRLFPFWPELVEERRAWRQTAKSCPGIGKGELIQIGTACEIADEMRRAYPHMY
ncbi:MAG TPA: YkgJ family cysteine cluster protein [Bryobacteraceae bacterium]|nr:YkgJ family cysteine cluster protein [Bryobacteraceae bacterium]